MIRTNYLIAASSGDMTLTKWLVVVGLLIGGILVGLILSRLVHSLLGASKRPKPIQDAAKPLGVLAFWASVIVGLFAALGILQPDALVEMPKDILAYLPKVISAAIIVILANVLVSFILAGLGQALARASASVQRQVASLVKGVVMGLAVLLAVAQLGIDTTVVNLGVAAIFFGTAASITLLVGLGGRGVASQVASTRAARRLISEGDRLILSDVSGTVLAVHPTSIELSGPDGELILVPSSRLINETVSVERVAG